MPTTMIYNLWSSFCYYALVTLSRNFLNVLKQFQAYFTTAVAALIFIVFISLWSCDSIVIKKSIYISPIPLTRLAGTFAGLYQKYRSCKT